MIDLFPDAPRRPRRVMLHVTDAGEGCTAELPHAVHLKCSKCGHDAGWLTVRTVTEARRQPCPNCNREATE